MSLKKTISQYEEYRKKVIANNFVDFVIGWDMQTEAPNGCVEERTKQIEVLSKQKYSLRTDPENIRVIKELYDNVDKLPNPLKHEIIELNKEMEKIQKIPSELYIELNSITATAESIWKKAKNENNYEIFKPTLKRIVELTKQYVKCIETEDKKGYDVLLDEYEENLTMKDCDLFFNTLKKDLVPFIKNVTNKKLDFDNTFASDFYPKEKQKEFLLYLQDVMGFDRNRGTMKESEHPFTDGFATSDVRFTVHYYEDLFTSAIFSAIHEMGHAIYEQQCDPKLDSTLSGGGASMALHESQSRFFENIVGRSYAFWERHFPKLKKIFKKQLKNVTVVDFVKLINTVQNSLIRTEADELTYPLHIMLRYDIEKALLNDEISIDELPSVWNKYMKEYFGIDVPSDKEGVLQDVHWAGGSFGYFPTYALGSAYGAQILNAMKKDLDFDKVCKEKTLKKINAWLKKHIHKYGATLPPNEILFNATGEKFNPSYYVEYLIEKYSKIYDL